ncbi:ATP-binding protein [Sphingobacterium hungaricum]|uniref:ATP-binding protein n=1 Tax=Sphingobacterium hungaricum TaxID=2082723 RepID=UPI0018CA2F7C|nr:ATP-binding protein [Sphingobacterium hungaricum]
MEDDVIVYTEVGNDIKEIGKKLVFTQVKCYTTSFSFRNKTLRKEILHFFVQYLQEKERNPSVEFHFLTNTSIANNERLLQSWMNEQDTIGTELFEKCCGKVEEILNSEFKLIKRQRLDKKYLTRQDKEGIKQQFTSLGEFFKSSILLEDFVKRIKWYFSAESPEKHINTLQDKILTNLGHPRFNGRPPKLLMEALLSEIYRFSQLSDASLRKVDNTLLNNILLAKDSDIKQYVNESLLELLDVKFSVIYQELQKYRSIQEKHSSELAVQGQLLQSLRDNTSDTTGKYPKDLTLIPNVRISEIIGRKEELRRLTETLEKAIQVNLAGEDGVGKTTLVKIYLNVLRDRYDHLLWIDCENGLLSGVIQNTDLIANLGIEFAPDKIGEEKFLQIIRTLNSLKGRKILVLDNLPDLGQLETVRNLSQWDIIVTSMVRLPEICILQVERFSFADAKDLFRKYEPERHASDEDLKALFEYIEYNTLIIELTAKTIRASYDLNVSDLLRHFKGQSLDDVELDIEIAKGGSKVRLVNFLLEMFDLSKLSKLESFFMGMFALLPSSEIYLSDLVTWFGKDHEKQNKVDFANLINSLHERGLVTREGDNIKVHKMLQEALLYKERKSYNPFVVYAAQIGWLVRRFNEGAAHNPVQAMRFLKYGQSILSNIKEAYRGSVYQPLLVLENEVLNILFWLKSSTGTLKKWEDLINRATKYLLKDNLALGSMFNNYAYALIENGEMEKAMSYLKKSIKILRIHEKDQLALLICVLCNLARLHAELDEFESFNKTFNEITSLRKKYNCWEDPTFPIQCNLLALVNQKATNYSTAIDMYNIAINAHLQLPNENRNELNLVLFLSNLAMCYLFNREEDKAEHTVTFALEVLRKLEVKADKVLVNAINILLMITTYKNEEALSVKLKKILETLSGRVYTD